MSVGRQDNDLCTEEREDVPAFEVSGSGRDSGRRRQRVYLAVDEAHAKALAEADGTVVTAVTQLPPEPPTDRQLAYVRDLGISLPADASKEEVGDLIEARLQRDKPAAPHFHDIARQHGVLCTQYTGKKALFDRLLARLGEPGREEDMVAWFVFRVYRELVDGRPDAHIKGPDEPAIRDIARLLASEEAVLKSIRRYQGRDLVWFGEWTSPDGTLHRGGSNQTIAYKRASSLLREKVGAEVRAAPTAQPRAHAEHSEARPERIERPGGNTTGCLSAVVVGAVSLLAVLGTSTWLAKAIAQQAASAAAPQAARR